MALNFEKYAQEGNAFINNLAKELEHPEETARAGMVLRAVLHSLRERITISESLHLLSQLPMFLKAIYADNWKFREKPQKINTKEEFINEVEEHQKQFGEQDFNWNKSTEEIIRIVFRTLDIYVSNGEFQDITDQLPKELKDLLHERV
ncbi:MAG: DUF2267 domain-containing protein [Bacteroidota bacterium]